MNSKVTIVATILAILLAANLYWSMTSKSDCCGKNPGHACERMKKGRT